MLAERGGRPRLNIAIAVDQDRPVDQRQRPFGRMCLLIERPQVLDLPGAAAHLECTFLFCRYRMCSVNLWLSFYIAAYRQRSKKPNREN